MAESDYSDGPTVRDSTYLHFHACPVCGHSWGCVSRVCMMIRDMPVANLLTGEYSIAHRLADPCRKHRGAV